jgi:PIN domain nuclease of toxin-antitoxin system
MRLLLDTHVLLWAAGWRATAPGGLTEATVAVLNDRDNDLYVSAASLWEITIKQGLGRSDFHVDIPLLRRGLRDAEYVPLPITEDHAIAVSALPDLHRDPFDRILIAQASVEGLRLVTADRQLAAYPGPIWLL